MLEKEFMPDKTIICEQIAAILQKFIKNKKICCLKGLIQKSRWCKSSAFCDIKIF